MYAAEKTERQEFNPEGRVFIQSGELRPVEFGF